MRLPLVLSSLFLLPLQWGATVLAQGVAADLPNPCTTSDFRAPVYKVSNFTLSVQYIQDAPYFRLTDEANNYSVQCNWKDDPNNYQIYPKPDEYAVYCGPNILQGYPAASGWYDVKRNYLNITQWWVCDPNDGSYPGRIESYATVKFQKPLSCPNCTIAETRGASSCELQTCTIADQDIPTAEATFKYPPKPSAAIPRTTPASGKDQPSSVPDNDTPCIGTSFSYPNWDVSDLSSLSGGEQLTFNLRNHPLNASILCSLASTGKVDCKDGTVTKTQGIFDAESGELSLEQTWTCLIPGETRETSFTASGKRLLSLDNHGIQIIRGTLSKPLNFKPNIYIPAAESPNCRKLSEAGPSFDIKARTEQLSAGTFTTIGHYGSIWLDLTNNANGLSMHCEVKYAPELNNCTSITELKWFNCLPPDSNQFGVDQGPITQFTFNVTSKEIVINQTWYCNEDETQPVRFNVVTKPAALPLQYRTQADFSGGIASEETRCDAPRNWLRNVYYYVYGEMDKPFTIPAAPKEAVSSTPLPPYSISERKPTGRSCTIASVIAPRLTIDEATFTAGWDTMRPIANGRAYTGIYAQAQLSTIRNSAFPDSTWARAESRTSLVPRTEWTDYSVWYSCPGSWSPDITACMWTFDFYGGYLAINQTWSCNDKDLSKPITFHASSSMTFNKTCSYTYAEAFSINCKIELTSKTLYPNYITNDAKAL